MRILLVLLVHYTAHCVSADPDLTRPQVKRISDGEEVKKLLGFDDIFSMVKEMAPTQNAGHPNTWHMNHMVHLANSAIVNLRHVLSLMYHLESGAQNHIQRTTEYINLAKEAQEKARMVFEVLENSMEGNGQ